MQRVSVETAFAGQPGGGAAATGGEADAEAVVLAVRGGELIAVVPRGTADEAVLASASRVRYRLRLENEHILTFDLEGAAARTFVADQEAGFHQRHSPRPFGVAELPGDGAGLTAAEIMSRNVMTASPDELVEDVAKRLMFHNISGMPVEAWDGKIVGVVSEADVIEKIGVTIADVMSQQLYSVGPTTPIGEIIKLMGERHIKRVPVMDGEQLAGIVSRGDIVRAMAARTPGGAAL